MPDDIAFTLIAGLFVIMAFVPLFRIPFELLVPTAEQIAFTMLLLLDFQGY